MVKSAVSEKLAPKVNSLEEEIAKTAEKLRKLQEKQKELQKKERERSQKAVFDLIKLEKLDVVNIELWTASLPAIRKLLGTDKQV